MKKYKTIDKSKNRILAGIILGFLILVSIVPAMAEEPSIALNPTQPTTAGSIEQISWSYVGVFESNVTLELFKDGILDRTIISDTFIGNVSYYNGTTPYGNGSYNWSIPISLEAGTYQIKIISKTTTGLELTNTTDIEITTPTEQGCRYCHSSGIPDRHHVLDYYGEYECTNCHPVVLNNGSYETLMDRNCIDCHYGTPFWANPLINPGKPHLNPNLIVTNPNGDSWEIGTAHTIRWNYTGNVGPNAKIELLKNGTLIQTIRPDSFFGHSYENSYNWTVPEVETGSYQTKVTMSNVNGSAVYANTSDVYIQLPSITVTSPITGDNWVRGTTETIRWTYTGDLGNYATIELLEQGIVSQTWNNVSQSSGAGSYDWAIPSNFKVSTYQIRVSAGGYSNTTGNFNIVKR